MAQPVAWALFGSIASVFGSVGLFAFLVVIILAAKFTALREHELRAQQELRTREMEHARRINELEIERARLELEKAKIGQA